MAKSRTLPALFLLVLAGPLTALAQTDGSRDEPQLPQPGSADQPALVTADEAGAHDAIEFALDLNGERMQESSTADLIFSIPALVSHLSRLMTLEPGDIVATGTPSGVGSTRQPRVWLKPGDEVVVTSPQLGELRTTVG